MGADQSSASSLPIFGLNLRIEWGSQDFLKIVSKLIKVVVDARIDSVKRPRFKLGLTTSLMHT